MSLLDALLEDFASMEGVTATALVDQAGFVIESTSGIVDSRAIGPMTATSIAVARSFIEILGRTPGNGNLTIETDGGFVAIQPLTDDESLAVIANHRINLGKVLYKFQAMRLAFLEALRI